MHAHALPRSSDEIHQCSQSRVCFTRAKESIPKHVIVSNDVPDSVLHVQRSSCALACFTHPKRATCPN
ncbi:hypothetical protein TIFTF001_031897 [Ficus carica]|uniref:Uncharacterized protein n=1 Tax=Ficus carica TaxID=3494 RepID=A0AA88J733_FICCA|nr:hypothetical protein TIFTF001_031897 [Ficus carica]